MVMIEMREAAKERAFDLVEEGHELGHEMKMVLCELEDTLYDCFEDDEAEDKEREGSDEGTDLGFKNKRARNYGMRNFEDGDYDKDMDTRRAYRHAAMRMRRNRVNKY